MAILIQRLRLRFVWLLTRHPRFRPLYHADIVAADAIEQAEFLCSAGYYVAAAMLSRLAVESRIKRYAMLTPEWGEYRKSDSLHGLAFKLRCHGRLAASTQKKIGNLYIRASKVVHGDTSNAQHCRDVIRAAAILARKLDHCIAEYVMGGRQPAAT